MLSFVSVYYPSQKFYIIDYYLRFFRRLQDEGPGLRRDRDRLDYRVTILYTQDIINYGRSAMSICRKVVKSRVTKAIH